LASKMTKLCFLKMLTSEVEVEAGVKIEVRYILGLSRSTTTQNLEALAQKLGELGQF
jgi:hypothetical protein